MEIFGEIDEEYVESAGKAWIGKKKIFPFSKKAAFWGILALLGLGAVFQEEVRAAVGKAFTRLAELLGAGQELASYTELIHTTQEKEGFSLSIREVIWTENSLIALMELKTPEESGEAGLGAGEDIFVNGFEKNCGITSVSESGGLEASGEYVVEWVCGDGISLEEEAEITLNCTVHRGIEDEEGIPFEFSFRASREELTADTLTIEVKKEIQDGEKTLTVESFSLNPVSGSVLLSGKEIGDNLYELKVREESGKEFWYSMAKREREQLLFQSDGAVPSMESERLFLTLYILPEGKTEKRESDGFVEMELGEAFRIDREKRKPFGNEVIINLKEAVTGAKKLR